MPASVKLFFRFAACFLMYVTCVVVADAGLISPQQFYLQSTQRSAGVPRRGRDFFVWLHQLHAVSTTLTLLAFVAMSLTVTVAVRDALRTLREVNTVTLELSALRFKVKLPDSSFIESGRIKKRHLLGQGQFGAVYAGDLRVAVEAGAGARRSSSFYKRHGTGGNVALPVAIKTVKGSNVPPEDQKGVVEECVLHMSLDHANIVRCYGWAAPQNSSSGLSTFWVVLELMDGGGLDAFLRSWAGDKTKGPIPESWCVHWAWQVASALAYMHGMNVVHRDIAARNVVLQLPPDGHGLMGDGAPPIAKVTDFGLSRAAKKRRRWRAGARKRREVSYYLTVDPQTGQLRQPIPMGWTAPECLGFSTARAGHEIYRASTGNDVWAWGVLLWEITSGGQTPYSGASLGPGGVPEFVRAGGRLAVPDGAPAVLGEAMVAAWTTDPHERPTMDELCGLLSRSPSLASAS